MRTTFFIWGEGGIAVCCSVFYCSNCLVLHALFCTTLHCLALLGIAWFLCSSGAGGSAGDAVRDHNVEFKSNLWICKSVRVCVCVCVCVWCVCVCVVCVCVCVCVWRLCVSLSVCLPHCLGLHYVCICTSLCMPFFLFFFSFMIGRFTQQLDNLTGELSCLLHPHRVSDLMLF